MAETILFRQLSLAVRFRSILFPFDTVQFLRALEHNGFVVLSQIGEIPFGARLDVGGVVARKGPVSVAIDLEKQILGVHTPNPQVAADEFSLVEGLLAQEFDLDITQIAAFYEFLATCDVKANKNPMKQLQAHLGSDPFLQKISAVLGKDTIPFGLRLVPRDAEPNSPEWFEFRIEPKISLPSKEYNVIVVHRSAKRETIISFAKTFNSTLSNLVSVMES